MRKVDHKNLSFWAADNDKVAGLGLMECQRIRGWTRKAYAQLDALGESLVVSVGVANDSRLCLYCCIVLSSRRYPRMNPKHEKTFALAMAEEGLDVRIVALRTGRALDRRLTELGLNIGSQISVVQRQGAGLLVARGEARVAVGGGVATKIMVVPA